MDEEKGQISTQGWVGIGLGAAAIIGTIAYVLAKEPTKSTANKVKLVLSEPPDEMALRLELRQEQRNNWAQEQLDNGEKLSPELQEYCALSGPWHAWFSLLTSITRDLF